MILLALIYKRQLPPPPPCCTLLCRPAQVRTRQRPVNWIDGPVPLLLETKAGHFAPQRAYWRETNNAGTIWQVLSKTSLAGVLGEVVWHSKIFIRNALLIYFLSIDMQIIKLPVVYVIEHRVFASIFIYYNKFV